MSTHPRSRISGNLIRATTALLLSGAATVALVGCNQEEDAQAKAAAAAMQRPPAPVTAVAASTANVPVYLDEIGKIIPIETVSIIPQVGGKITASHVEDGAYVTKGQLLFEIDPRPFEAALASAKATLAQNQAELYWAQADFGRTAELKNQNVASQLEYDQKKSIVDADVAKVEAAKAAIEQAALNLEYTKIYSPVDGRAGAILVDPGNIVKANEGNLLVIQRLNPIYAEFTVTENDLGTVRKYMAQRGMEVGNEASLGLRCEVDVPADSKQILSALGETASPSPSTEPSTAPASTQPVKRQTGPREGKLTFLDNSVQNGTGTIKLRATLPNADHYFWPGLFVNVRLILTTRKDAVLIPAEAQQIGQQGPYVFIVKPDDTAELRPIVPGQRQGNMLVIEQGVQPGEKVVVTGQMMVQPGGKVTVTNKTPPVAGKFETRNSKSENL